MSKKRVLSIGFVVMLVFAAVGLYAQFQNQTTVAVALANQQTKKAFEARASATGLSCSLFNEYECEGLIERAEQNPELKKALLQTQASGVSVFPRSWPWFTAGSVSKYGWIDVNTWTSDEKIITFLTK